MGLHGHEEVQGAVMNSLLAGMTVVQAVIAGHTDLAVCSGAGMHLNERMKSLLLSAGHDPLPAHESAG